YAGVSAEYLVWVVPLAIALRERMALLYSAAATLVLVAFYGFYHPGILFGRLAPAAPPGAGWLLVLAAGNVLLVLVSWLWVLDILAAGTPAARGVLLALGAGAAAWAVFFAATLLRAWRVFS